MNVVYDSMTILYFIVLSSLAICFFWIGEKLSSNLYCDIFFGVIFFFTGIAIPRYHPELLSDYISAFGIFCFASGIRFFCFPVIRFLFPDQRDGSNKGNTAAKCQQRKHAIFVRSGNHPAKTHGNFKKEDGKCQAPKKCFSPFLFFKRWIKKCAHNPDRKGKHGKWPKHGKTAIAAHDRRERSGVGRKRRIVRLARIKVTKKMPDVVRGTAKPLP